MVILGLALDIWHCHLEVFRVEPHQLAGIVFINVLKLYFNRKIIVTCSFWIVIISLQFFIKRINAALTDEINGRQFSSDFFSLSHFWEWEVEYIVGFLEKARKRAREIPDRCQQNSQLLSFPHVWHDSLLKPHMHKVIGKKKAQTRIIVLNFFTATTVLSIFVCFPVSYQNVNKDNPSQLGIYLIWELGCKPLPLILG